MGLYFLMRVFSSRRASSSEEAKMVSKLSIEAIILRVLTLWEERSAKYWLTRLRRALAFPT